MAREHSVRVRCDVCHQDATRVEVPIKVGRARATTLDLCDRHYKELIQPVLDVLAASRPYSTSGSRSRQWAGRDIGPFLCQAGCASTPLKNMTTLTTHLQGIHRMTRAEYVERYGQPVPLTPEELQALVVEIQCTVKDCKQVYSTALGNRWPQQAMRSHMWGAHHIKWSPADGGSVAPRRRTRPRG